MATLVSLNVGLPKNVSWQDRTVYTGIWKESVDGPRMVRRLNVDGDGQGDLNGHGGEQRAVLVYQLDSYRHWAEYMGRDDLRHGNFGENFTVDGLGDDEVCIGDRYRIGEAVFEVTQPRVTCYRVGMRLGVPDMPSLLVSQHRPGFYMRVITEGRVQAGDEITKLSSGPGQMTVADIDALLYLPDRDVEFLRVAVSIPALSPGWQQSFRELLDGSAVTGPPVGTEPGWSGFRPLKVARVVPETDTVASIYLESEDGTALPAALPGQYLTLRVDGAGTPAPVRNYSLSSPPGASQYRISVKREPHGLVSGYLHRGLTGVLDVAAPRGEFVLDHGDGPVVLISAGIGVTPVMAMLHQLAAEHSKREVWWIHAARNQTQHALASEAHELLGQLDNTRECVFYTAPDAVVTGTIRRGRLDAAAVADLGLPAGATAYLCGPDSFMTDTRAALLEAGLSPGNLIIEQFGSRSAINPGLVGQDLPEPHQPPGEPGTGPEITFARSGLSVRWPTNQRSLLDLAESCDVPTRWSCRTGVCHTCVTPVLTGEVTYATQPLEPPPPGETLLCCTRPTTDLVLDL
jgi:ferredoxin-NADP reductase/MOSC domain-containing protein YiiM